METQQHVKAHLIENSAFREEGFTADGNLKMICGTPRCTCELALFQTVHSACRHDHHNTRRQNHQVQEMVEEETFGALYTSSSGGGHAQVHAALHHVSRGDDGRGRRDEHRYRS